jgi:hypothetical protein
MASQPQDPGRCLLRASRPHPAHPKRTLTLRALLYYHSSVVNVLVAAHPGFPGAQVSSLPDSLTLVKSANPSFPLSSFVLAVPCSASNGPFAALFDARKPTVCTPDARVYSTEPAPLCQIRKALFGKGF